MSLECIQQFCQCSDRKKKSQFNLTLKKKDAKYSVSLGIYHAFALCWCYHIHCPIIKNNVRGDRIHIASHRGFA